MRVNVPSKVAEVMFKITFASSTFFQFSVNSYLVSCSLAWYWYGLVLKFHKMEIVHTWTATWRWRMGMFGARFAVFVRRARVLPGPCPATRNLSFWRFHRHRHPVVSTRCFIGNYRTSKYVIPCTCGTYIIPSY